jgi:hypothetical protein
MKALKILLTMAACILFYVLLVNFRIYDDPPLYTCTSFSECYYDGTDPFFGPGSQDPTRRCRDRGPNIRYCSWNLFWLDCDWNAAKWCCERDPLGCVVRGGGDGDEEMGGEGVER